ATPYIIPREGGCILCSGLPCVLACPTGALNHDLSLGKDAKMGLAVITNPETCLCILGINDLVFRLENLQKENKLSFDQIQLKEIFMALIKRLTNDEKKILQKKFGIKDVSDKALLEVPKQLKSSDLQWIISFVSSSDQAQKACRICLEECPIKDEKPIVFVHQKNSETGKDYFYPSVTKTCVGCGVCEEKCPTKVASITITPRLEWSLKTNNQIKNK
ncbi:MAG: hypothetical protein GY857_11645, partial [Desulfobacula sp.]|nr:hypothetical protein [Desulfobacula sp.]